MHLCHKRSWSGVNIHNAQVWFRAFIPANWNTCCVVVIGGGNRKSTQKTCRRIDKNHTTSSEPHRETALSTQTYTHIEDCDDDDYDALTNMRI